MMDISERSFEDAIEQGLLQHGPDAPAAAGMVREALSPYGDAPGGYHRRRPALCLVPRDVVTSSSRPSRGSGRSWPSPMARR